MRRFAHPGVAAVCIAALLSYGVPVGATTGARLEGRLLDVEGRPAVDHAVLLVDPGGQVIGRSSADGEGIYRFRDLPAGTYGIAVESPEGLAAPVLDSETRVEDGALLRRDIKLVDASSVPIAPGASGGGGGLGAWWAGLSKPAKAWTVVGVVLLVAVGVAAFTGDDEDNASDFMPPPE